MQMNLYQIKIFEYTMHKSDPHLHYSDQFWSSHNNINYWNTWQDKETGDEFDLRLWLYCINDFLSYYWLLCLIRETPLANWGRRQPKEAEL